MSILSNIVYEGDCLEVMRQFPDNCIDTILTDPPYGLSFMGKDWDYGIPGPAYWREALRVAKPGAILMAFGGTRTYHRLACAIEDAGWEIRDCISYFHDGSQAEAAFMASLDEDQLAAYLELHYPNHQMSWVYGSGFPKSHNVSKAIDNAVGAEREVIGKKIDISSGKPMSIKQAKAGTDHNIHEGYDRPWRKDDKHAERMTNITAPATPLAAKFDGWGSAMKPAFEPIILAMKPMGQSYAANAETWGVAGLWIDGCRIGVERIKSNGECCGGLQKNAKIQRARPYKKGLPHKSTPSVNIGRYPANVILDGSETVEAEFAKAGVRTSGKIEKHHKLTQNSTFQKSGTTYGLESYGDSGSASRYFAHCPPDPNCLTCTDCITEDKPKGRYPANVILDGSETVEAEFAKAGVRKTGGGGITKYNNNSSVYSGPASSRDRETIGYNDSGSASRYFAHCPSDTAIPRKSI